MEKNGLHFYYKTLIRSKQFNVFFTKRLEGLWNVSYRERLVICGLVTLELRRIWTDLILCFKIVHKLIDIPFDDYFTFSICNKTRGHNFKLSLPSYTSNVRCHFFPRRVVPMWNFLSSELVNVTSVAIFKKRLKCTNFDKFLVRTY